MRVVLQSRVGSIFLGVLGVIYAVSSLALLVYYIIDTWGAASLTDRVLQLALVGAAAIAIGFVRIAARSLGLSLTRRRSPRHHRADVAVAL